MRSDAQALADTLLKETLRLDRGKPTDDSGVPVVIIVPTSNNSAEQLVRRMNVSFSMQEGIGK